MYINALAIIMFSAVVADPSPTCDGVCAGQSCASPSSTCVTLTETSPISTIKTTCIPTPTCLGIYQDCTSGGVLPGCCSEICAADLCRPYGTRWPDCAESYQLCQMKDDCCFSYDDCVDGICRRPA